MVAHRGQRPLQPRDQELQAERSGRELVQERPGGDLQAAAERSGKSGSTRRVEAYADALGRQDEKADAKEIRKHMVTALRKRGVPTYLEGAKADSPAS